MTKKSKNKARIYQSKSRDSIYRCNDCGELTEHDRYAFYRAYKPKCMACGSGQLAVTSKPSSKKPKPTEPCQKKPAKWDGHDEALHQTQAELEEINAVGIPITWVSGWVGGRSDWEDHVPNREDQLRERALKNRTNQ